jgi:hypothetical protein
MSNVVGVVDRVLAKVGKRVVAYAEQRGSVLVQVCSTVGAAPCPTCRCWSGLVLGTYRRRQAGPTKLYVTLS